jgi:hypothetical protein
LGKGGWTYVAGYGGSEGVDGRGEEGVDGIDGAGAPSIVQMTNQRFTELITGAKDV